MARAGSPKDDAVAPSGMADGDEPSARSAPGPLVGRDMEVGSGAVDVAHLLPEAGGMLGNLPTPPTLGPDAARFRLFDSTTTFLKNSATVLPIVLVLDESAMRRIGAADAGLAAHLEAAVRTGTVCVYVPVTRAAVDWRVSPEGVHRT